MDRALQMGTVSTTIDAEKTYLNMGILMHSYTILYNLIQSYTVYTYIYIVKYYIN